MESNISLNNKLEDDSNKLENEEILETDSDKYDNNTTQTQSQPQINFKEFEKENDNVFQESELSEKVNSISIKNKNKENFDFNLKSKSSSLPSFSSLEPNPNTNSFESRENVEQVQHNIEKEEDESSIATASEILSASTPPSPRFSIDYNKMNAIITERLKLLLIPSKRLRIKNDLRKLEIALRDRDNKEYELFTKIAIMIKEHARLVLKTSGDVNKFINNQNQVNEILKSEILKVGSLEIGSMSSIAQETQKAIAFSYCLSEQEHKKQFEMQEVIDRSNQHLSEICDVVKQVVDNGEVFRSDVNTAQKFYDKDSKNDISNLNNGKTTKKDPFLVRRKYKEKIQRMENYDFPGKIDSLVDDLLLSDGKRLETTRQLLIDYFETERRSLKNKMELVEEALGRLSEINTKKICGEFRSSINKMKSEDCEATKSRQALVDEARLETGEIVKSGRVLYTDSNSSGQQRSSHCVLTLSGQLHMFGSEYCVDPFLTYRLTNLSSVRICSGGTGTEDTLPDTFCFTVNPAQFMGKSTQCWIRTTNEVEAGQQVSILSQLIEGTEGSRSSSSNSINISHKNSLNTINNISKSNNSIENKGLDNSNNQTNDDNLTLNDHRMSLGLSSNEDDDNTSHGNFKNGDNSLTYENDIEQLSKNENVKSIFKLSNEHSSTQH